MLIVKSRLDEGTLYGEPDQSYDTFHTSYVNKFTDYHVFEIVY